MSQAYTYACKDYPGLESCPGRFIAETEEEIWKLLELHAVIAHGEKPEDWSADDRAYLRTLIRSDHPAG